MRQLKNCKKSNNHSKRVPSNRRDI